MYWDEEYKGLSGKGRFTIYRAHCDNCCIDFDNPICPSCGGEAVIHEKLEDK